MQEQLDSQKKSSPDSSSGSRRPTSVPKGRAKTPQPRAKDGSYPSSWDGSDDDDDDDDNKDDDQQESNHESSGSEPGEPSQGAMEGRLRRLCEKKPSGKLRVPEEVHVMWKKGGHTRKELLKKLQDAGWNEDPLAMQRLPY